MLLAYRVYSCLWASILSLIPAMMLSQHLTDSLTLELNRTHDVSQKADLSYQLSLAYRATDPDSAMKYGLQAHEFYQLNDSIYKLALSHQNLGKIHYAAHRYQTGIRHFLHVMTLQGEDSLLTSSYSILNLLATGYKHIGKTDSALYYYLDALKRSQADQDSLAMARVLVNMGSFYHDLQETERAFQYMNEGIALLGLMDEQLLLGKAYLNRGPAYFQVSEYEKAIRDFESALEIFEEENEAALALQSYGNIAIVAIAQDKIDQAALTLNRCFEIEQNREHPNYRALISYSAMLGGAFVKQKAYAEALPWFRKSMELNRQEDDLHKEAGLLEFLAISFEGLEQYDSALVYEKKFHDMQDSLFNMRQARQIADLEDAYQAEQKDQLIRLQTLEMRETRLQLYLSWGIGLGLLIMASILLYAMVQRYRRSKLEIDVQRGHVVELLKEKEMSWLDTLMEGQEIERVRMARELHDRLGSKLSTAKLYVNQLKHHTSSHQTAITAQLLQTETLIDETVQEVRNISHQIEAGILTEFGLKMALRDLCTTLQSTGVFEVYLDIFEEAETLDPKLELGLFRITQEALNNAVKYASASQVFISLNRDAQGISLIIEDDGVGFNLWETSANSMGLRNMQARAQKMDGELLIESQKGAGTSIIANVPL